MAGSRGFVAVYPPAHVVELLDALDRSDDSGVRWVPDTQWHVTLRFLGNHADLEAIDCLLRTRFAHEPIDVRIGPAVAHFGGRVLQVPVSGLDSMAAAIDAALEPTIAPPNNPFVGHLTLGRPRRHRTELPLVGTPVEAQWRVDEICLVRIRSRADSEATQGYSVSISPRNEVKLSGAEAGGASIRAARRLSDKGARHDRFATYLLS